MVYMLFRKHITFLILCIDAAPLFSLCLKHLVSAPVSLSPPPPPSLLWLVSWTTPLLLVNSFRKKHWKTRFNNTCVSMLFNTQRKETKTVHPAMLPDIFPMSPNIYFHATIAKRPKNCESPWTMKTMKTMRQKFWIQNKSSFHLDIESLVVLQYVHIVWHISYRSYETFLQSFSCFFLAFCIKSQK